MLNNAPFEIIMSDTSRIRCHNEEFVWRHALAPGTIDTDDKTTVEILQIIDDELEVVSTFHPVICVGKISDDSYEHIPPRGMVGKCPICGQTQLKGTT